MLGEKLEELDAAAQRLAEVVRLRPRDEKALELLAGVYANPNWIGADGVERAAAIYYPDRAAPPGGGRHRERRSRRCAGRCTAVPGHAESSELLERVYYDARRFQELDRFYRERVAAAATEAERIDFLYKRAQLAEGELDDVAEAQRVYNEISLLEPPGGPASEKLVELYLHGQDYAKLAELRERQLGAIAEPAAARAHDAGAGRAVPRPAGRSRSGGGLPARGAGDRAREPDGAGRLRRALPREGRLGGAGRPAGVLVRARAAGAASPPRSCCRGWRRSRPSARSSWATPSARIAAWQRAEEIAPTYSRAREAQRRLLLKSKSWDRLAALLEREAAAQADPAQRAEILRRVAQIYREKLGKAARAIEIYKDILRADPTDAVSMRAVVETYEREGDFVSLAQAAARADRSRRARSRSASACCAGCW